MTTSPQKKGVAINYASHIHYNDHLAPISVIMGIPLMVVEEKDFDACKKYYPSVDIQLIDYQDFNPEYLISHFDVLFMSDLWDRDTFREKFAPLEKRYGKVMRNVHCPHGFSDKGFYLRKTAKEDIALVYGQNMLDQFKDEGVFDDLNQFVLTGNYRYTYYKMHKEHFDHLADEIVFNRLDPSKKTILYAPTWMDLEESSTFFELYTHILDNLPDDYNLIVKLHPQLELDDTSKFYQIIGKYQKRENIVFLTDCPLVFPLLARSALYLGDMSSIGYDFLAFNRPLFFLNKRDRDPDTTRGLFLYRCGVDIRPANYPNLYSIITTYLESGEDTFSSIRKKIYDYTFGEERSFNAIKQEIIAAYNTSI